MLGAIAGDIIGSRFEFNNHLSKDFELFTEESHVTDDSIMTIAVAKAIMETEKEIPYLRTGNLEYNNDYYDLLSRMSVKYMQEIGRKNPNCGYGGLFEQWVFSDNPEPYNSFGNGAAMRISPVGFAARNEAEAIELSRAITSISHNHEEGMKGAETTAVATYMAGNLFSKSDIYEKVTDYYVLDFTVDEIREIYEFDITCQGTVPQALQCFFESRSYEDAIRIAVSLGGDSDTIATITGGIAGDFYGIPDYIREKALEYLDDDLREIYDEWEEFIKY